MIDIGSAGEGKRDRDDGITYRPNGFVEVLGDEIATNS